VRALATSWTLQASLATLAAPFEPCSVEWGGAALRRADWSYDAVTQVLRARFDGGSGVLLVRRECGPPSARE
jgi:hypothetical protein